MNKIFLSGEKINLCIPEEEDFEQWAGWFNSQEITKFLEQGKYPNTTAQQKAFYSQAIAEGRFLCLIKTKDGDLLGVVSLSDINYEKSSCQVAYVCPNKTDKAVYAPLEALAICTQHAFERFGVHRVWAGHSYPGLDRWIQKTEILGFKADGIVPSGFRHGMTINDAVRTSITQDQFLTLVNRRNGVLWPGEGKAQEMLAVLRTHESLAQKVRAAINDLHAEHDRLLKEIEFNVGD